MKKLLKGLLKYPLQIVNRIYTYFYYKNNKVGENCNINNMFIDSGKVLVLSPHVDDETIGLGATLLKYKALATEMSLVYMTDGGGSTTDISREELVSIRKKEGMEVKEAYGFETIYFLDEVDGRLDPNREKLINKLVTILETENPTIIYTPFLLDGHRDHVGTTKALIKALKIWNKTFKNIYMYEVNLPIEPKLINSVHIMDKSDYMAKDEIYKIFKSQWVMGFNAFRLLDKRKRYLFNEGYGGEVFVKVDLQTLLEIEDFLDREGFKPEEFKQLSSHYNLLLAFNYNKALKSKYNEGIYEIIKNLETKFYILA